jgi:hypothetical protein
MRVITDVASSRVGGRRSKRADARRSNADRAAKIMGRGGNACIGVHREMPRGYAASASHGGSCEHGCGDERSRQKCGLSHFFLHLADPLLGLSDNQTCVRAPVFPNVQLFSNAESDSAAPNTFYPSGNRVGQSRRSCSVPTTSGCKLSSERRYELCHI